jgi:electron transfer flavoprotein alpha subunit
MAVNTDPEAAILQIADVGIIGDYTRVIPEMIKQVKERMAG